RHYRVGRFPGVPPERLRTPASARRSGSGSVMLICGACVVRSGMDAHRRSSLAIEGPSCSAAVRRSDSLELEQKRAKLTRADVLGRVLLGVAPHRGAGRKLDLLALPRR